MTNAYRLPLRSPSHTRHPLRRFRKRSVRRHVDIAATVPRPRRRSPSALDSNTRRCSMRRRAVGSATRRRQRAPTPAGVTATRTGPAAHPSGVRRWSQRPPAGLLPQQLRRRRGHRTGARDHTVRGHRRSAGVPVLGRARLQGHLLDNDGRRRLRRGVQALEPLDAGPATGNAASSSRTMPMSTT